MALNYSDRETLRPKLVPRCQEAVRKYLLYLIEKNDPAESPERVAWCEGQMTNISQKAEEVSHYLMSEPTFISDGTSITDAEIQSRVESVLVSRFDMPA